MNSCSFFSLHGNVYITRMCCIHVTIRVSLPVTNEFCADAGPESLSCGAAGGHAGGYTCGHAQAGKSELAHTNKVVSHIVISLVLQQTSLPH